MECIIALDVGGTMIKGSKFIDGNLASFFEERTLIDNDNKASSLLFLIKKIIDDNILDDKLVGLIFNYKDNGTFYTFVFNDLEVKFFRYVDNKLVGWISQSVKWKKTRKAQQNWRLESDGSIISFYVDELPIMSIRYMPLDYNGFGYYTWGKQKLTVDDVEFVQ